MSLLKYYLIDNNGLIILAIFAMVSAKNVADGICINFTISDFVCNCCICAHKGMSWRMASLFEFNRQKTKKRNMEYPVLPKKHIHPACIVRLAEDWFCRVGAEKKMFAIRIP